jgi:hypothetical protein
MLNELAWSSLTIVGVAYGHVGLANVADRRLVVSADRALLK